MKILFIFVLCFAIETLVCNEDKDWQSFKLKHGKKYISEKDEAIRKGIFNSHLRLINKHNQLFKKGNHTFSVAINKFADLTTEEFVRVMNGYKRRANKTAAAPAPSRRRRQTLPTSVNWTARGYVTPVKDQGECGSCYAFSATGSLEGQLFKSTGVLTTLSEQNIVDCSYDSDLGNFGCDGGWVSEAFDYIMINGGIDTQISYPYTASRSSCKYKAAYKGATVKSYTSLPEGNEKALQYAVATVGPISIAIDASDWTLQFYSSGIYYNPSCSTIDLDHAVLATGYGTFNNASVWYIKNSWGKSWGMLGYMLMPRNKNNYCGVATNAEYPIL